MVICRFCGEYCHNGPLLEYAKSPQSAQGFLDSPEDPDCTVDLKIYQCASCGLVQHNSAPVHYYRDVIRAIAVSPEMAKFRLEQLSYWIKKHDLSHKQIVEVGCGKGEYLDLLSKAGCSKVSGIENSILNVTHCRNAGFDVRVGYLDSSEINPWPNIFDAFVSFNFMEHWPNLKGSLSALHQMLKEGAVGLIEVPNFDFIIQNGLYSEFTVDHIFYFDRQTLRTILEMMGFEVVSINNIWYDYILSAEIKKRRPFEVHNFASCQTEIINRLNIFINQFEPKDVVVWGAGHQALAVLVLAGLAGRISHLVDSARNKQNKYTPGTRILIKDPVTLLHDKPKAIVIMAAAYSDEIKKTIIENYPFIERIAILRGNTVEVEKNGK